MLLTASSVRLLGEDVVGGIGFAAIHRTALFVALLYRVIALRFNFLNPLIIIIISLSFFVG